MQHFKYKCLLLLMAVLCYVRMQGATEIGGIYYKLNATQKTAYVESSPNGYSGHVVIPENVTYEGVAYTVNTINLRAFQNCTELTGVSIPNTVTTIGQQSFEGCSNLTSVYIPSNVSYIDTNAFSKCVSLEKIVVDANNQVFDSRENCNAIIHKQSNTLIFACRNTVIPSTVTNIGSYAYYGCTWLVNISIPNQVTTISQCAFRDCTNLELVEIGSGLKSLENQVFLNCPKLSTIVVSNENTSFDSRNDCNGIIDTHSNTLVLGCRLTRIPETVTALGDYAFWNCNGLTSILIPKTVTTIGTHTFRNCENLESITVEADNPVFDSRSNCNAIISTPTNSLLFGCKNTQIPEGVVSVGSNSFYACSTLTKLTLPSSVTNIGDHAFYNCTGLNSVRLDVNLATIGKYAFSGCTALTDVYCYAMTPPTIDSEKDYGAFSNSANMTLHVPASAVDDYKAASYWKDFKNIVPIDEATDIDVVTTAEYFVNTDPGIGKAKQMLRYDSQTGTIDFEVPASELLYGMNVLGLRLKSSYSDGKVFYSPTVLRHVYRHHAQDAATVGVEYFLNADPGIGNAKRINATSDEVSFSIPVEEMEVGINVLGLRAISSNSETGICYSPTRYQYVYRPAADGERPVEYAEYFWDTDPGPGNATPLTITTADGQQVVNSEISYQGLYGEHTLCIRVRAGDVWSNQYRQLVSLPVGALGGTIILDPSQAEDVANGVFQTLSSLLTNLSTRGIIPGAMVTVADGSYTFNVTEQSLAVCQALRTYLETYKFYLLMKAPQSATFNFVLPADFIAAHQSDLPQIIAAVQALFSHIITENISITVNDKVYNYDGFQVEPNDLLALKNLYNRLGGEQWTQKTWSFLSNGRDKGELPGVSFDNEGYVTAIDLSNNNLRGALTSDWGLVLPRCTLLNLSGNAITGDLTPFLEGMTALKSLYMQNNGLSEISGVLPASITTLSLNYQNMTGTSNETLNTDMLAQHAKTLFYLSDAQQLALPTLYTYNHSMRDHSTKPTVYLLDANNRFTSFAYYTDNNGMAWKTSSEYTSPQDADYYAQVSSSIIPVTVRYVAGDANMSGATDVLDVQHTLNRILSTADRFNYSAANTYKDDIINVQDIVCTVNIVLDNESAAHAPRRAAGMDNDAQAWLYTHDGRLMLSALDDVAALDITLTGVNTSQVALLLNHNHFQMIGRNTADGSRYVIFSPTGHSIAAREAVALLKLAAPASIVTARAADIAAQEVTLAVNQAMTGIRQARHGSMAARFDGNRLLISADSDIDAVSFTLTAANGMQVMNIPQQSIVRGDNSFDSYLTPGVYILRLTPKDGTPQTIKLLKRK